LTDSYQLPHHFQFQPAIMMKRYLLSTVTVQLADKAIAGYTVRTDNIAEALNRNPILVTALHPVIGYAKGAVMAKQAYKEGRAILDVAKETTGLSEKVLKKLLDPAVLAKGGIHGGAGGG
jgi:fumarate hydratase class II